MGLKIIDQDAYDNWLKRFQVCVEDDTAPSNVKNEQCVFKVFAVSQPNVKEI